MANRFERRELFIATMADPEALDIFCDRISDGETLTDLAKELNANYRWLYNWFHDSDHPERGDMLMEAEAARDSMAKEDVIGQLHRLSNMDIRKAFGPNGDLLPIKDMPIEVAKGISSIDTMVSEGGDITKKVKFVDRGQMIALSGRRQRLFVDKVEVTGQMSLEQAANEACSRRSE